MGWEIEVTPEGDPIFDDMSEIKFTSASLGGLYAEIDRFVRECKPECLLSHRGVFPDYDETEGWTVKMILDGPYKVRSQTSNKKYPEG
jgi:hypothetical protein